MNRLRFATAVGSVICLCMLLANSAAAQPLPPPHAFFGAVSINDQAAPAGTVIEARGEGVRTGIPGNPMTSQFAGYYGGPTGLEEKLVVQGQVGDGDLLSFYVNGERAQVAEPSGPWVDSYPFHSLAITPLNLRLGGSKPSPSLADIMARPTPVVPTAAPSPTATRVPTTAPVGTGAQAERTATPRVSDNLLEPSPQPSEAPRAEVDAQLTAMPQAELATPTPQVVASASSGTIQADLKPAEASASAAGSSNDPVAANQAPAVSPAQPTLVRPTVLARPSSTPQVFAAVSAKNDGTKAGSKPSALDESRPAADGSPALLLVTAILTLAILAAVLAVAGRIRRQRRRNEVDVAKG
jgi:hypothetical protein